MSAQPVLQKHGVGMLVLLGVECLLGVWTSLFVEFPENQTASDLWSFGFGNVAFVLHALIGVALFAGAVALLVMAYKRKDRQWKWAAWVGLVGMVLALTSGERFVSTQNDWFSMLMTVGLVGAAASYVWGVIVSKGEK